MLETIRSLPKEVSFNILDFSEDVHCWKETLVPANPKNKEEACAHIERLDLALATHSWAALKTALDMSQGQSLPALKVRKKDVELNPDVDAEPAGYGKKGADTIFFLSDGMPWLDGKPLDAAVIADQVRDYNRVKRVVIHTIGIGQGLDAFMRRLAEESGGTFTKIP
jgi:hypothetical protein